MHAGNMRAAGCLDRGTLRSLGVFLALAALATDTFAAESRRVPPAPARKPVVLLLPGIDGPARYRAEAARLSRLGYHAVLLESSVDPVSRYGEKHIRDEIARAQRAPEAKSGKVAVIGFSMGGGEALAHAAPMADLVAAVIVYYPYIGFIGGDREMQSFASRFAVPVLALSGEADRQGCCAPEAQRALESAARSQEKQYELVLYPGAQHGFNLTDWWDATAAADAQRRADEMLKRFLPLGADVPARDAR